MHHQLPFEFMLNQYNFKYTISCFRNFISFYIKVLEHAINLTLLGGFWRKTFCQASTRRACLSSTKKFDENKQIFSLPILSLWFKVEEFRSDEHPYFCFLFLTCQSGIAPSYILYFFPAFSSQCSFIIQKSHFSQFYWVGMTFLKVKYDISGKKDDRNWQRQNI